MGSALSAVAEAIGAGRVAGLVVLGANPVRCGITEDLLARLELLVVIDVLPNPATAVADYLLPGATWAEKRGSYINGKGRLQRFSMAVPPCGEALPDWQILAWLLHALLPEARYATLEEVFAQMAATLPALAGLSLGRIGDQGTQLEPTLIPAA
jgi:predicted molibdopterin-dependent oxidoreductase YjgC